MPRIIIVLKCWQDGRTSFFYFKLSAKHYFVLFIVGFGKFNKTAEQQIQPVAVQDLELLSESACFLQF